MASSIARWETYRHATGLPLGLALRPQALPSSGPIRPDTFSLDPIAAKTVRSQSASTPKIPAQPCQASKIASKPRRSESLLEASPPPHSRRPTSKQAEHAADAKDEQIRKLSVQNKNLTKKAAQAKGRGPPLPRHRSAGERGGDCAPGSVITVNFTSSVSSKGLYMEKGLKPVAKPRKARNRDAIPLPIPHEGKEPLLPISPNHDAPLPSLPSIKQRRVAPPNRRACSSLVISNEGQEPDNDDDDYVQQDYDVQQDDHGLSTVSSAGRPEHHIAW
ncbi:hypothetical protein GGX14DRAFT_405463 [Mycena pura]|uniref:Uncharacterized protein n=1 Tax=Mycena pura TaxID=153505 RepID=A0AAD6UW28_9AGAR|nr:hypothetical protein GGX14DRAFT_405463 [Mycena pura]